MIYMTATEKKEGNKGLLTVTVPAEKVNKALDQAFKKVVKQINVLKFIKVKCHVQFSTVSFWCRSIISRCYGRFITRCLW